MSSYWAQDEDEAAEAGLEEWAAGNDALVVLIDARANMLETNANGEILLHNSLKVVLELLKNKIMFSDRDSVGVVLYGTREKRNPTEFPHVYVLQELGVSTAARIRDIEAMLLPEYDFERTIGSLPADGPSPLKDALWASNMAFTQAKLKDQDDQRIWIFTNDDNPNAASPDDQERAVQQARDCADLNRTLHLWHLNRGGAEFDVTRFWTRMFSRVAPGEQEDDDDLENAGSFIAAGDGSFSDLLDKLASKKFKKRRLASLPFVVSQKDGMAMAIGLYSKVMPVKPSTSIWLERRSNVPVKTESKSMCATTGGYLDKAQVRTFYDFGGERVRLSAEEVKGLKSVGCESGLLLMGFKPLSQLPVELNVRAPWFAYPDDAAVEGSISAFAALHAAMLAQGKFAVVRMTRTNANPRFVAMVAQEATADEACGMHVIPLPYADDIRDVRVEPQVVASDTARDAAVALVNAVDIAEFHVDAVDNPALQKHYACLQALALEAADMDWKAEEDDHLQPSPALGGDLAPQILAFRDAYGGSENDPMPVVGGKRKAAGDGGGAAKKPATAPVADDDWKQCIASGTIQGLTVPAIKAFLKEKGERVTGKKADLIARVAGVLGVALP